MGSNHKRAVRKVQHMNFLCEMIVVLEVIVMNLCIFKKNAKRRYPLCVVLLILSFYTVILLAVGIYLIRALGIYGNGNGLFTMFGFFYLLPLHYLFEGTTRKHFYIICFAWIYTLSVFIVSVQMGYALTDYAPLAFIVMVLQTLFFGLSYYFVNRFMDKIYITLMQCHDEGIQKNLNKTSLLWFINIFFVNMHFILDKNILLKIITILVLIVNAFYSFTLLYDILMKRDQIGSLEDKVSKDTLTGLGSRIAFDKMMENKIQEKSPFYFIYMDLDEFKKINDKYGHLTGDRYLKEFSGRIREIGEPDMTFRISGDEFVMLVAQKDIKKVVDALKHIDFILPSTRTRFRGVSFGIAHFPKDSTVQDHLIYMADQRMYASKTRKKR